MKLQGSFLWILLPVANFFVWYFYGVAQRADQVASICGDKMKELLDESLHALRAASDSECEKITSEQCSHKVIENLYPSSPLSSYLCSHLVTSHTSPLGKPNPQGSAGEAGE